MRTPVKVAIVATSLIVVALLIALIASIVQRNASEAPAPAGASPTGTTPPSAQRENSHVLDDGSDGSVTVVEFLDFECEACGAFYPIVEDLRSTYKGKITYVVRYFPLPGHLNSTNAAVAAEAAARQGRFEEMYRKLFETQTAWAEAKEPRTDVFRGYAQELGLDMAAYDRDVADPATLARVQQDVTDGRALGVNSTPTFFVDDAPLTLKRIGDLGDAIDAAVRGRG